ncbi:MAG: prolipoprotein diacylglyceryl transferase [Clostridia bacterium]|nr:prolipoprotein diacylglyceryl transferase [Clostridia bacterium]
MNAIFSAIISFFENIGLIFDPTVAPQFFSSGKPFYMSFEGLGIKWFKMNPVAIPIGNGIRWYGIIITLGIILAVVYVSWRAKSYKYNMDDLLDSVLVVVPLGVLGARLFYVFTADGFDLANWYRIWDGGLAIYGGIIGGAIGVVAMCLIKKMRMFRLMDCTAPAVMIAQSLGRWGNFCNGEAFGGEYGGLFRMGLSHSADGAGAVYVHPTFLYESVWNLIGFILINLMFKKKKFDGQIVLTYLGWYGLGRFFIELLRQDSLPLVLGSYNLRISSVIGFICFAACLVVLIIFLVKPKSAALQMPSYYPGSKRYAEVTGETAEEAVQESSCGGCCAGCTACADEGAQESGCDNNEEPTEPETQELKDEMTKTQDAEDTAEKE